MRIAWFVLTAALTLPLAAQPPARLPAPEALALFERATHLIESTSAVVPGLARAAAPVLEDARQTLLLLQRENASGPGATYALLSQLRAYLALAETVPKPYPFPEAARRQFAEYREAVDRIDTHFRALLDATETQLRGADRDNLARYREDNERLSRPAPNQRRVVFLGDSITDAWRLHEYFPGRDFVNRGISGQITGQMLGRMKADVLDLQPQAVVVLAGTNDLARGVDQTVIRNNLTMIADLAEKHRIRVLLASILPVSDYHKDANPGYARTGSRPPARIRELNDWIKAFCASRGFTYVDYYTPLVDGGGMLRRDYADDGLHPNAQGYRVMAPVVLEAIDRALGGAPPAGRKRR